MKLLKSNRRTALGEAKLDELDDFLRIKLVGPLLQSGIHLLKLAYGGLTRIGVHLWIPAPEKSLCNQPVHKKMSINSHTLIGN